ncbi:MAG: copper resistance protein CopC [Caldilineaceae bacterium]
MAGSVALLGLFVLVTAVAAHATTVVKSDPAGGAVVTGKLTQVTAQFSEELHTHLSTLQVLDAAGKPVSVGYGKVDLDDPDHKTLIAVLQAPLPNGVYTVQWHVLLTDGDASDGKFQFTVAATTAGAVATAQSTVGATAVATLLPTQPSAEPANPDVANAQGSAQDAGGKNNNLLSGWASSFMVMAVAIGLLLRWWRKRQVA